MKNDKIVIANKKFNSRLIVGTGKYKSMTECANAIKLSEAEIVTVAVRRVNITDKKKPLLMRRGFFLSVIFTLLTATVTISASESLIAFAHSVILLYLPVPTINRELNFLFAITILSFFI